VLPPRMKTRMKDSRGRKQFLLRLSHDLFENAKSYADRENISITQYINRAVKAYVEATKEVDVEERNILSESDSSSGEGWWMN